MQETNNHYISKVLQGVPTRHFSLFLVFDFASCNKLLVYIISIPLERAVITFLSLALLRRGTARKSLRQLTDAKKDLEAVLNAEPNNKQALVGFLGLPSSVQ